MQSQIVEQQLSLWAGPIDVPIEELALTGEGGLDCWLGAIGENWAAELALVIRGVGMLSLVWIK